MIVWWNRTPASDLFQLFVCRFAGKIVKIRENEKYDFLQINLLNFAGKSWDEYFIDELSNTILNLKIKKLPPYTSDSNIYFWEYVTITPESYSTGEIIGWYIWKLNKEIIHNNWPNPWSISLCKFQEYYYSVIWFYICWFLIIIFSLTFILKKKLQR